MAHPIVIHAAVEGLVDEAVARRLLEAAGASAGDVHGRNGKAWLHQKLRAYNEAARYGPWLILVDLDQDAECAPPLRRQWLPNAAPRMCFRIAVHAVEAWLMADAASLASFLRVPAARIPADPESIPNPKQEVVNLARQSRLAAIREDMVPREGSGCPIGPAYSSRLIEFVNHRWRPEVAAKRSESLKRAIERLTELVCRMREEGVS